MMSRLSMVWLGWLDASDFQKQRAPPGAGAACGRAGAVIGPRAQTGRRRPWARDRLWAGSHPCVSEGWLNGLFHGSGRTSRIWASRLGFLRVCVPEPSRLTPGGPQRIDSVRLQRVDVSYPCR
ncbi:hypothetical protein CPSG_05952 [Coccidioides posadasii str. Silveira]|uniref:Uncharacterized protein n=1 Tax=Coccidioides posadasii (strain RMSCC 757 / Silveira) TaxID=443226 RepID=E9D800_COCPS|nr:hypothetical protein CPSG_05952 [Coccidioides posadasii str. Silveira]